MHSLAYLGRGLVGVRSHPRGGLPPRESYPRGLTLGVYPRG